MSDESAKGQGNVQRLAEYTNWLTPNQRRVWEAIELHGLTGAEMAERRDVTPETIYTTRRRAHERLKEIAEQEADERIVTDGGRATPEHPEQHDGEQGRVTQLLHVDLCAGNGGWQSATADDPRWQTVGLDVFRMPGVDIQGDVRALPLDCRPDLLTMSPPCTEFARWMLPWCDEPNPDLSLVEACLDAVESLRPRFWILENSRGLSMYWREARKRVGPYYLWGEFPPFDVDTDGLKGKMQTSGTDPAKRAEIPRALSHALKGAVETFGGVPA